MTTRARSAAETVVAVRAARRGAGTVLTGLAGTEPWCPRVLAARGSLARVALVGSRASLLAGDAVVLDVELGPGAALELVELGATVAHHARSGRPARLDARVRLGRGARLIWLGQPLIAAAGCRVRRSTAVELAAGAAALLGDAVVLGRVGEEPGRVRARTRITLEGRPLLEETLDTEPGWRLRSEVVVGGAAMVEGLTLAGVRDPRPPPGTLDAHEPATLWRDAGPAVAGRAAGLAARWRELILA